MATGFEVQMYHDIHRIAVALERIADEFKALRELAADDIDSYQQERREGEK